MANNFKLSKIQPYGIQVLILAGLYFFTGLLSSLLSVSHDIITLVIFAPEGFALAAVIVFGKRLWLGIFIGQFLYAIYEHQSGQAALGIAIINSLEAVIGGYLFKRCRLNTNLINIGDICYLWVLIICLLQPFSATFSSAVLYFDGIVNYTELKQVWLLWWLGNILGQVLITPLLLLLLTEWQSALKKINHFLFTASLALGMSGLIFATNYISNISSSITVSFALTIPLLIVISALLDRLTVNFAVFIFIVSTLVFTKGLQVDFIHNNTLLFFDLNIFLLSIVLTGQLISVLLSQYKLSQALIKKSEAEFRHTFENVPIGIAKVSLDEQRFLWVNQTYCDILGYSHAELLTMTVPSITYNNDIGVCAAAREQLLTGQIDCFIFERQLIKKDSSLIWIKASGKVIYQANGAPDYFLMTADDITQRKQIDTEIINTRNELQATLNAIPDLLFELDSDFRFCHYHTPSQKLLLIEPEFFLGKSVNAVMPKASAKVIMDSLSQALQTGVCLGNQFKIEVQQQCLWFELSVALKLINNQAKPHFIMLSRDITQRKQIEQALYKSEELFRHIFENAPLGIALVNPEQGYIMANQSYCDIFGYSQAEMLTKTIAQLTPKTEQAQREQLLKKLLSGELTEFKIEKPYLRKDNSIVWTNLYVRLIFQLDGAPNYYLTLIENIDERKKAEEALKASEAFGASIINSLSAHIAVLNAKGDIIMMNRAWLDFLEKGGLVTPYETLPLNYFQVCHNILGSQYNSQCLTICSGVRAVMAGQLTEFNTEYSCDFGNEQCWFYISVSILQGLTGSVVISHENITARKLIEQQLSLSEKQFKAVINITPVPMRLSDTQGNIIFLNPAFVKTFGYDLTDTPTLNAWWSSVYPDRYYRDWVIEAWQAELIKSEQNKKEFIPIEITMRCKDNSEKTVLANAAVICQAEEKLNLAVFYDITERKQAETQLRIAAAVFESQEGMFITDTNSVIIKINQAFSIITGYSAEEVIGKTPRLFRSGKHDKSFYALLWQSLTNTGSWQGEIWNKRKNGEIYPQWLTVTAVKAINSHLITHYVATLIDITERKNTEEYINQLAFYDPLTQLPNRRLLQERLKHSIEVCERSQRQMAILMLDLDKFKAVNDTLGHTAGDALLQQVALRIKACLRRVDMVARLGGDEFMVLIENISHYKNAARLAEAIIQTLTEPFMLNQEHKVYIGVSIGISIYPQHGDTADILRDNADAALYYAKGQGRGCFAYFSEELTQKARERLNLEYRLRHAIENEELRVYFQAQVDLMTGDIIGAEALVRWYDPIHGQLMPNEFIGLAEETGLILPLGEWVLKETCRLGQLWRSQGLPAITLAVNVSPYQFRRCDINQLVTKVLTETGFPAQHLELEITESGLMDNQEQALAILNNLHELGIKLAIDDFGTGYSSLAYLKYFPLDVLKIDKTFIDDIPFSDGDMAITATIIAMAHHLGFKVLAEGVETQEQLNFLKEQGCDNYQGYWYSKPIPAHDFAQLLRRHD